MNLVTFRVPTCLENLEISGINSCHGNVRDFTKSQGNFIFIFIFFYPVLVFKVLRLSLKLG